ncbi:beta-lactamase family protein [Pseudarthrobacter equi]|uniref:serine hydrolase domain-containing protein n=1 Tax=Pseudarthrobacter equi TaxID=728066 RepID=UPI0021C0106F|nr:serine hydrolase domain-containing protein [Pseudarthrobacter equi]MCT9623949.1 beta-lactamase family protein [Pseudarthrobacter equi]
MLNVTGDVAPGFGPVADAFKNNFERHGDTGAACAVVIDGDTVVDLFAGDARPDTPWARDTRSVVFSVSKGVTAICLIMASERGYLDLDLPVARYWPEFAAHGKDRITVRQLLAHRAGLVYPATALTPEDIRDWTPAADALAAQAPQWAPNETFAYHPLTMGFLAGEVLRRTTGKKPSEWLAAYIAEPLNLTTMTFGGDGDSPDFAPILPPLAEAAPSPPELQVVAEKAMTMSGAYDTDFFNGANGKAFLGSESPGANLVASARDLARLYAATVSTIDGTRLLDEASIDQAVQPLSEGQPFYWTDEGNIWGTGFMLHSRRRRMAGAGSFGHDGAGGQLAFASPRHRLGFAYQTVQAGNQDDPRAELLSQALLECL